jgi:hypothetical protein
VEVEVLFEKDLQISLLILRFPVPSKEGAPSPAPPPLYGLSATA